MGLFDFLKPWKLPGQQPAPAEKIARIFDGAYRDLRANMRLLIESGATPRYADRVWLEGVTQDSSDGTIRKDVIYYKDNEAAFDSACDFMDTKIKGLKIIPALVERTAPTSDGLQMAQLKLASVGGGTRISFCTTIDSHVPKLSVGDLVAFKIAAINPEWEQSSVFGCIGFIVARLEPAISASKGWKVSI